MFYNYNGDGASNHVEGPLVGMKKQPNLYRMDPIPTGYNIIKFDEDLNFIESYGVVQERGRWFCSCPNTMAPICRHMKMVDIFKKKKAIGKNMFYCYDTEEWTKLKE